MNAVADYLRRTQPTFKPSDLSGWNTVEAFRDGEAIGTVIERDGEIHYAAYPGRESAITTRSIHAALMPLIGKYGFLTTRLTPDQPFEARFVQRIGFVEVNRTEQFIHYWLDATTLLGGRYAKPQ